MVLNLSGFEGAGKISSLSLPNRMRSVLALVYLTFNLDLLRSVLVNCGILLSLNVATL